MQIIKNDMSIKLCLTGAYAYAYFVYDTNKLFYYVKKSMIVNNKPLPVYPKIYKST